MRADFDRGSRTERIERREAKRKLKGDGREQRKAFGEPSGFARGARVRKK